MEEKSSHVDGNGESGIRSKNNCVICLEPLGEDSVKLYKKGLTTLIEASLLQGDMDLNAYLTNASVGDVFVHKNCRKKYTDKRTSSGTTDEECQQQPATKTLRSSLSQFDYKTQCVFCGKIAVKDIKHPDRDLVFEVRALQTRYTIKKHCDRLGEVADDVRIRLNVDLVAEEARYHDSCYKAFTSSTVGSNKPHRPVAQNMNERFEALCHWLENDGDAELYTLSDLHNQMTHLANGEEVYGEKHMRQKLMEHYGDHIFLSSVGGSRKDVVCFKNMASYIVSDKWYKDRNEDSNKESERVMIAAAKLVREEIRSKNYNKDVYPGINEIQSSKECQDFLTPDTD
jgi:hypothetical protein